MTQKNIAVYEGEGTSLLGLRNLDALFLSEASFFQSNWDQTCSHFIMPGGRDRPYHTALRGAGNQKIRSFVERGGTYIGICAGAYYAASSIEFEKGFPLEICEERELSFFPGKAIGPIFEKGVFSYTSGAIAARLSTSTGYFLAYYHGGCTFVGDLGTSRVLASYADLPGQPPAIIECSVGRGKAILSGVHLEVTPDTFPELLSTDAERLRFYQAILPKTRPPIR